MLYEVGGMAAAELNYLKSLPNWQARVLAAPTIPREVLSVRNYLFDSSRFRKLETPTLFLLGAETTPVYRAATETLHSSLQNSRIIVLPGQGHDPVVNAPELFSKEVIRFFHAR